MERPFSSVLSGYVLCRVLALMVVIMGKWSECNFVSVDQVTNLNSELSIAVMSGDVGVDVGLQESSWSVCV